MKIPTARDDIPNIEDDFSEYMWMENEDEFEQEVMKQLEEEALMEQCIEAMLEDELENNDNLISALELMGLEEKTELAKKSNLNPDAAEFVPRFIEGIVSAANEKSASVKENFASVEDITIKKKASTVNGTNLSNLGTKENGSTNYGNDVVKKENWSAVESSSISLKKS